MYNKDMGNYNTRDDRKRKSSSGYGDKYSSGSEYDSHGSHGTGYDTRGERKKSERTENASADNVSPASSDYLFHEKVSESENGHSDGSAKNEADSSLHAAFSAENAADELESASGNFRQVTATVKKSAGGSVHARYGYSSGNFGTLGADPAVTESEVGGFGTDYSHVSRSSQNLEAKNCSTWMIAGLVVSVISGFMGLLGPISLVVTIMGMVKVKSFFAKVGSEENHKMVKNALVTYVSVIVLAVVSLIVLIGIAGVADTSAEWVDPVLFLVFLGMLLFFVMVNIYLLYVWVKLKVALDLYR